jgi:rubrerythrin
MVITLNRKDKMNIKQILDEIEKAYPKDIFPETSEQERREIMAQYPGFIDRTSAMMGRHLAGVIRRKLNTCDECGQENVTGKVCPTCGARRK